ncbi:MAG: hypothetical protein AB7E32_14060 [Desulfovibrio sp.]
MSWQDGVITVVGWSFSLALVPMLRRGAPKPSVLTALCNCVLLLVLAVTLSTLGTRWGAASTALTGAIWGVVGVRAANERAGR